MQKMSKMLALCLSLIAVIGQVSGGTLSVDSVDNLVNKGELATLNFMTSINPPEEVQIVYCGFGKDSYKQSNAYAYAMPKLGTSALISNQRYDGDRLSVSVNTVSDTTTSWNIQLKIDQTQYNDTQRFGCTAFFQASEDSNLIVRETTSINLDIRGGPTKCGSSDLLSSQNVSVGDEISLTVHLCGRPKPQASCNHEKSIVDDLLDPNEQKYEYRVELKPITAKECGTTITCYATANGNFEKSVMRLNVNLAPEAPFLLKAGAKNDPDNNRTCLTEVEWSKPESGNCSLDYTYEMANVNVTIETKTITIQQITNLCIPYTQAKNVTHIRVRASATNNGEYSSLKELKFEPPPTKMPVIVVDVGASEKDEERDQIIGGTVGGILLLILIIVMLLLIIVILPRRRKRLITYTVEDRIIDRKKKKQYFFTSPESKKKNEEIKIGSTYGVSNGELISGNESNKEIVETEQVSPIPETETTLAHYPNDVESLNTLKATGTTSDLDTGRLESGNLIITKERRRRHRSHKGADDLTGTAKRNRKSRRHHHEEERSESGDISERRSRSGEIKHHKRSERSSTNEENLDATEGQMEEESPIVPTAIMTKEEPASPQQQENNISDVSIVILNEQHQERFVDGPSSSGDYVELDNNSIIQQEPNFIKDRSQCPSDTDDEGAEWKRTPEPSLERMPPDYLPPLDESKQKVNSLDANRLPTPIYAKLNKNNLALTKSNTDAAHSDYNPSLLYAELGPGGRQGARGKLTEPVYAEVAIDEDGRPKVGDIHAQSPAKPNSIFKKVLNMDNDAFESDFSDYDNNLTESKVDGYDSIVKDGDTISNISWDAEGGMIV